jgi:hypothetical protein
MLKLNIAIKVKKRYYKSNSGSHEYFFQVCLFRIILVIPTSVAMPNQMIPIVVFTKNKAATNILNAVCIELLMK